MSRLLALGAVVAGVLVILVLGRLKSVPAPTQTSGAAATPKGVLLITLDTVRADRLGAYGYAAARTPNLDALAREGVRFDDATAPSPLTGPAHASLLTGLLPGRLGVVDNVITPLPDRAVTIAEALAPGAFATGAFVGAFILDRPYGFAQGFETFGSGFARVDPGSESNAERTGDAVVDDALKWLTTVPSNRRFFGCVHLYDAHAGYHPPAPFAQDYDGEIAFVDQQIGRLLTAVRERGTLAETLVIAVGDHGESLGEHGEDEHGVFLYDAVLRIPFIAAGPGLTPSLVVAEQVRGTDLVPTILDLLALPAPPQLDGTSLKPLLQGRTRTEAPSSYSESDYPKLHFGWSELRAIRADGWKAIDAPKPELYNLREDPREQNNLYASQPALAARMLAEASGRARELGAGVQPARQPDAETLERLRSLGYVGSSAASPSSGRGPDPKDRIGERREYNVLMSDAIGDLRSGRPASAIPKFKRLLQINDRAYDLHQFLGEAYDRLNRREEALGEYELAAMLNPKAVTPLVAAAEVHLKRDEGAKARRKLEDAAKIEPQAYEVLMLSGRLLLAERRPAEALAAFEKAVEENPANPRGRTQTVGIATQIGRWDVAERHLRKLLEMGYQPSRTYFALGRVAQAQGRNADAVANYREALRLEPGLRMAKDALQSLGGETVR